ncbi:MAG TPA: type II toxin-antitoxin system Phd/YefM family antitoxin [Chloroflexota bacterium]|nr:type II toxin-antitoxin system Phd/YefM family antitoxin [Chloroflexota bacterium]
MAAEGDHATTRVVSAFKARQNFGQILEQARYRGHRFLVERAGKPMAVVVGIGEWENIVETLAELDDPEYLESIKEARREIELGQTLTLEELRQEFAKAQDVL